MRRGMAMSRKALFENKGHFALGEFYDIMADVAEVVSRAKYIRGVYYNDESPGNSMCREIRHGNGTSSDIFINLYEFRDFAESDMVPDERVAAYITRAFHEQRHGYQNAVIDRRTQHDRLGEEIAAMGLVCEFFPVMYMAGYCTDVREYDAEIGGIMGAAAYCAGRIPGFDYETAMLDHSGNDGYAIIKGAFKNIEDMLRAGLALRDEAYGRTKAGPAYRVPADTSGRLDKAFVMKYIAGPNGNIYETMSGHEQVAAMIGMLDESGIMSGRERFYPAFSNRYDLQLMGQRELSAYQKMLSAVSAPHSVEYDYGMDFCNGMSK